MIKKKALTRSIFTIAEEDVDDRTVLSSSRYGASRMGTSRMEGFEGNELANMSGYQGFKDLADQGPTRSA